MIWFDLFVINTNFRGANESIQIYLFLFLTFGLFLFSSAAGAQTAGKRHLAGGASQLRSILLRSCDMQAERRRQCRHASDLLQFSAEVEQET